MNIQVQNGISILQKSISENISLTQSCIEHGFNKSYIHDVIKKIDTLLNNNRITKEEYDYFFEIYNQIKNNKEKETIDYFDDSLEILIYSISNIKTITQSCKSLGKDDKKFHRYRNSIEELYNNSVITKTDYDEYYRLYNEYLTKTLVEIENNQIIKSKDESDYDERTKTWVERDEEGKIKSYHYIIYVRDEKPLSGVLTTQQMETIYENYPYVTQNTCSNYFPYLTFVSFKRILRAFNITKDKLFPPHIIENYTEDEIAQFALKAKETSSYKKFTEQKAIFLERELRNVQKKLLDIKEEDDFYEKLVNKVFEEKNVSYIPQYDALFKTKVKQFGEKTLFGIFGDIHFGKKFSKNDIMIGRGCDKDILRERMINIASKIIETIFKNPDVYNKIDLICLGDLIESVLPDGMHPQHVFEMDLHGHEQVLYAIEVMEEFILYIVTNTPKEVPIKMYMISGNHDRTGEKRDEDKSRTAGTIIIEMLKKLFTNNDRVEIINFKNNIIRYESNNISIIAHHGDSGLMKRKPIELMNLFKVGKSENYTLILNGHLHTTTVEEGINFTQLTVGSVCSADNFVQNELGKGSQPSFILGEESDTYGFDWKKITLY